VAFVFPYSYALNLGDFRFIFCLGWSAPPRFSPPVDFDLRSGSLAVAQFSVPRSCFRFCRLSVPDTGRFPLVRRSRGSSSRFTRLLCALICFPVRFAFPARGSWSAWPGSSSRARLRARVRSAAGAHRSVGLVLPARPVFFSGFSFLLDLAATVFCCW
jgi:hypothetical protein